LSSRIKTTLLSSEKNIPLIQRGINCGLAITDFRFIGICNLKTSNRISQLPLPKKYMSINFSELVTVSFTLFAVIDVIGSIPVLISLKQNLGGINELKATLISGGLMVLFLFVGESFLGILGLDVKSFAVGGSIVIFILGLEMVMGVEFFKSDKNIKASTVVPIAFPLIAGSGTLTTIMSLKANYGETSLLIAILANLIIVYAVLKSLGAIARLLGPAGLIAVRKFFGVILLAIAVKIFATNAHGLIK
jgi:multiple antibiotic resistance protein